MQNLNIDLLLAGRSFILKIRAQRKEELGSCSASEKREEKKLQILIVGHARGPRPGSVRARINPSAYAISHLTYLERINVEKIC